MRWYLSGVLVFAGCGSGDCPDGFLRDNDGNCLEVDDGEDVVRDPDDDTGPPPDESSRVTDVEVYCNGEAAVTDWLLEVWAWTDGDPSNVECLVEQRGVDVAWVDLRDYGDGEWYGSFWEDTVGSDCDDPNGLLVTCYAID
jgi:hypothetical protein